MAIDLDEHHNLIHKPSCAHCGEKMLEVPELKITLGFQKKIYGNDKLSRHHKIKKNFLSIKQIIRKTQRLCKNERKTLKSINPQDLRMLD
jgi:hypothetical protein